MFFERIIRLHNRTVSRYCYEATTLRLLLNVLFLNQHKFDVLLLLERLEYVILLCAGKIEWFADSRHMRQHQRSLDAFGEHFHFLCYFKISSGHFPC